MGLRVSLSVFCWRERALGFHSHSPRGRLTFSLSLIPVQTQSALWYGKHLHGCLFKLELRLDGTLLPPCPNIVICKRLNILHFEILIHHIVPSGRDLIVSNSLCKIRTPNILYSQSHKKLFSGTRRTRSQMLWPRQSPDLNIMGWQEATEATETA